MPPQADIYKVVVDSLAAHVAIIDRNGVILETNRAWQEFAKANGLEGPVDCVGMNYLAACDNVTDDSAEIAGSVAAGIRKVMAGNIEEYFTQYPCHAPHEKRWYALRAVRFRSPGRQKIIVTHEDITPVMLAQEALAKKEAELIEQQQKLEESNVALKVLLMHRDQDRMQMEGNVLANIRELVLPYIEKLRAANIPPRERMFAEIIEDRLNDIISPFLNRLSTINRLLTPQEVKVAALVREGRTSKEIADALAISISSVDFHRKNLRKKLGLANTGANLRSHLLSLR